MKRLYYLTDSVDVAESASDQLHQKGITDWNFHVLGQDKAQMTKHHLHSTTPLQELDIIRSGERGVLIGLTIGVLLTGYIALFTSFGANMNWIWQAAAVVLFALFGAWVGGLVGVSNENYKVRRFHKDIENGSYLLLVDVMPEQRSEVEQVMSQIHGIRKGGEDTTFVNPFGRPLTH
ncbi:MAG: hypothetical protein AAF197_10040 [Pseudomonadota bacterium]